MSHIQSLIKKWQQGVDDETFDNQLEAVIRQVSQAIDEVHPTEIPAQAFFFGVGPDGENTGGQAIFGEYPEDPELQQQLLEKFGKQVAEHILPVSVFIVREVWVGHGGSKVDGVAVSGIKISGEKNEAVAILKRKNEGFSVDHVHFHKRNDMDDASRIQEDPALERAVRNLYNYIAGTGHGFRLDKMKEIISSRFNQRARRN